MWIQIRAIIKLAIFVGLIFLQVYLSRMERRWPGLILPAICLANSAIVVFNAAFIGGPSLSMVDLRRVIFYLAQNVLILVLLFVLYAVSRARRKKKAELEKMKLQDLE